MLVLESLYGVHKHVLKFEEDGFPLEQKLLIGMILSKDEWPGWWTDGQDYGQGDSNIHLPVGIANFKIKTY